MYDEISDNELELADKLTNDIADSIQNYFVESVNSKYTQFCKVVVLVPLTENLSEEFVIDVPKEMMDEDNSTLLEYFVNHIYKSEDKYMTESINTIIAERDAAALRLEENLKNFDPEVFLREYEEYESPLSMAIISAGLESGKIVDLPEASPREEEDVIMKSFGIIVDPPCPVNTMMPADFDGDILEISIDDD